MNLELSPDWPVRWQSKFIFTSHCSERQNVWTQTRCPYKRAGRKERAWDITIVLCRCVRVCVAWMSTGWPPNLERAPNEIFGKYHRFICFVRVLFQHIQGPFATTRRGMGTSRYQGGSRRPSIRPVPATCCPQNPPAPYNQFSFVHK